MAYITLEDCDNCEKETKKQLGKCLCYKYIKLKEEENMVY